MAIICLIYAMGLWMVEAKPPIQRWLYLIGILNAAAVICMNLEDWPLMFQLMAAGWDQ